MSVSKNEMKEPIDFQILKKDGKPAFAVVPYDEFLVLMKNRPEDVYLPDEVVKKHVIEETSLLRAWREYRGLTQAQVASRLGISQSALAQMEKPEANPRSSSIKKLAKIYEVTPGQLQP